MKIPKSWNEVTIEQFVECSKLNHEDFETAIDLDIEVLSILTDEPSDVFFDLDIDELYNIFDQIKFFKAQPREKLTQKIGEFSYKNVNKISLGEFIDLEFYFADGYIKNLTKICAIFWRKTRQNEWNETIIEPYTFDIEVRQKQFNAIPIGYVYEIIPIYLKFRENFMNIHTNLFNPIIEENEEDIEHMDAEDLKAEQEEKIQKRWSWEQMLYALANEDITKIDAITDLPLIFVFNMMAMKKDLQL